MVIENIVQLSKTNGVPRETPIAEQPKFVEVTIVEGQYIFGLIVSRTVTNCEQLDELSDSSKTVHVTTVVPIGKAPGASLVMFSISQLSLAVGVPNETPIAVQPALVIAMISGGHDILGFTVSITIIS